MAGSLFLPTQNYVCAGSTVCVCVRRRFQPGGRQMRWYSGVVLDVREGKAWVHLTKHPGEYALVGPSNITLRNDRQAPQPLNINHLTPGD